MVVHPVRHACCVLPPSDSSPDVAAAPDAAAPQADRAAAGRRTWSRRRVLGLSVLGAAAVGFEVAVRAGEPPVVGPQGRDGLVVPRTDLRPGQFVAGVDHPWLPLAPGTYWTFAPPPAVSVGGREERLHVEVLEEFVEVAGIAATVVRIETVEHLVAQDREGHVWLLGRRGSAETRQDWSVAEGAPAGLVLPARLRRADGWVLAAPPGLPGERVEVARREEEPLPVQWGTYADTWWLTWARSSWAEGGSAEVTVALAEGTGPVHVTVAGRELELRFTSVL